MIALLQPWLLFKQRITSGLYTPLVYWLAVILTLSGTTLYAQSEITNSFLALRINNAPAVEWFDLKGNTANYDLEGSNWGYFFAGNSLKLHGAENKVYKCGSDDITNGTFYYRIYRQSTTAPAFSSFNLPWDANTGTPSCGGTEQKWKIEDRDIELLSGLATPGVYILEVYSSANFTWSSGSGTHYANNGGANFKGYFTLAPNCVTGISTSSPAANYCVGASTTALTAQIVTGSGAGDASISYQWYVNSVNNNTTGTPIGAAQNTTTATVSSSINPATSTAGTYYYYCVVTNTDANCTGSSFATTPVAITVLPTVTPSVTISVNPGNSICAGTSVTFTATPVNGGISPTYQWYVNGNPAGTNASTFTTTSLVQGDVVSVQMTSTASCPSPVSVVSNSITMTVNPVLTPSVSIVASKNPICGGESVTFTSTVTNGGVSPIYQWRLNGAVVGSNTASFNSSTLNNGDKLTLTITSNAVCASSATAVSNEITMVVNYATPAAPSPITAGTAIICPFATSLSYSIGAVAGATNYSWSLPAGWVLTSGNGTTSILATAGAAGANGDITVVASNGCGIISTSTLAVTVSPGTPAIPGTIAGPTTVCPGVSASYSVTPIATATSYNWNLPAGWSITSGTGTSSITVTTGTAATSGSITVSAQNSCGTSLVQSLAVAVNTGVPAQPGAISGLATVCPATANVSYSITAVSTATSYTWVVPAGWTINAGQGTTGITVTAGGAGQNGDITVTANNTCGSSTPQTLAVNTHPAQPAQPGPITGSATVCPAIGGLVYSIGTVTNAITYNWTVPTGWSITSGQGTTSITVTSGSAGQNGNVSVTASNTCGTSGTRSLGVTVSPATPATPGSISGNAGVCINASGMNYSVAAVPNASSYTWTLPAGWSITSGANTNTITVSTNGAAASGNITVAAVNSCGTSAASTLAVSVTTSAPATPGAITGATAICPVKNLTYSIAAVAGATSYTWVFPTGWTIISGQGTTSINVAVGTTAVSGNVQVTASNVCGTSAARILAATVSNAIDLYAGPDQTICQGSATSVSLAGFTSGTSVDNHTEWDWVLLDGGTLSGGGQPDRRLDATYNFPGGFTTGTLRVELRSTAAIASCNNEIIRDTMLVIVLPNPTAAITSASPICNGSTTTVTITGTANTTVTYRIGAGANQTVNLGAGGSAILTTAALSANTSYTLVSVAYTATPACNTTLSASTTITVNALPTVNAGSALEACSSGSPSAISLTGASIGGTATTGTWSIVSGGGSLSNTGATNSPAGVTYTPAANYVGTVTLQLTTDDPTGPCSAVSAQRTITVNTAPTVNAGPSDAVVCQSASPSPITLTGASVGGSAATGTWSIVIGGGTLSNNSATASPAAVTYTPAAGFAGTVTLQLSTDDPAGACTAISATRTITVNPTTAVNAGTDIVVCQSSPVSAITLSGSAVSGATVDGAWSIVSGGGVLSSTAYTNSPSSITYTPADGYTGNVVLQLLSADPAGPCDAVSDTRIITINQAATVSAGAAQTICAGSVVNLAGSVGGSVSGGTWYTSGTGSFNNNTALNAVYTPGAADIAAGSVVLTLQTDDPAGVCTFISATTTITINPAPTTNAGPNQTICSNGAATMAAVIGGSAGSGSWSTGGDGTFNNPSLLNAVYTPGAADKANGSVTLTFTTDDPAGPCTSASSVMVLSITREPIITTQPVNRSVCATFGVNLSVAASGAGLSYQWFKGTAPSGTAVSNSANITGATSAILSFASATLADAGQYYVIVSGTSPCTSVISQTVTLHVDQAIGITTQPVSQTVCEGANVTFSVVATTTTSTLSYQWRRNGVDISGADQASYTINGVSASDADTYDVVISGAVGFTCSSVNSAVVTLAVNPVPTVSASPNVSSICSYQNLTIALGSNLPGTTIQWTAVSTDVAGVPASGSATAGNLVHTPHATTTGNGTIQYTFTPVRNGCSGTPVSFTVTVRPLPTGSINAGVSGSIAVCRNSASPLVTFTGANGIAPFTFTYLINGVGPSFSVSTTGSNTSVTVPAPTTTAGTFVYSLVSVADASSVSCAQAVTGQTATVVVNPLPNATISGGTTVCIGATSPVITLTGSGGSAPFTFQYTINGVAQTPVSTLPGNSSVTINAPTGASGSYVYAITSVTNSNTPACSGTPSPAATTTVVVHPLATLSLSSAPATTAQTVCINNAVTAITYTIGGSATGATVSGLPAGVSASVSSGTLTIIGTPSVSGVFNFTVTTTGPCASTSLGGTLTVDQNPVGGTTVGSSGNLACSGANSGTITLSGHQGLINRWEYSTNGGLSWIPIANTATTMSYSNLTTSTWFRAVIGKAICSGVLAYSAHTMISVVPLSGPGSLVVNVAPQFICSGSATLTATGFGSGTSVGDIGGGEFDNAGVGLDGPGRWKKTLIANWHPQDKVNIEASTNNANNSAFNLTNGPKTFDLNAGCTPITYNNDPLGGQPNNNKFMAVVGPNTSSLETPIFNLIGLQTASMDWWESYDLKAGASIKIELSLDGGTSYTTTLNTITGPANFGNPLNFGQSSLNLNAYVGLSNLRIRFTYTGTGCSSWGLEKATITKGVVPAIYNWNLVTPTPVGGTIADHYLNQFVSPAIVVTPPSPNNTNAPITYMYSLQSSAGGCVSNIPVTVNPTPLAFAVAPTAICSGTTINIPITGNVVGTTYTWSRSANPSVTGTVNSCNTGTCNTINETLTNTSNTTQSVTYTITPFYSNGGVSCPGTPIFRTITIAPPVTATLSATLVCNGGSGLSTAQVQIVIGGEGAITGSLQAGSTTIALSGTAPATLNFNLPITNTTTYSLSGINVGACAPLSAAPSVTLTMASAGTPGLWVGTVNNDWFNACNWASYTVPNNSVNVTIPGTAVRFCEINPNTSPFATSYGDVARSANILITNQELRFGPSAPKLSLLNVQGNLTIEQTAGYVNMLAGGEIELTGHWNNNRSTAGFAEGLGTVELLGAGLQTINAVDTKETYNNLIVNNTSGADNGVTLNRAADVAGVLTLHAAANGRVLTTQTNLMTVTNPIPAAVVGGGVPVYINGPLARHTGTTGAFHFPVGKPDGPYSVYRPAIVNPANGAATVYNSEYFGDPGPVLNQRIPLAILNTEYWEIARTSGTTPAVVQLLYINPNQDSHWSDIGPSTCSSCMVAIAKNYSNAGNTWYFTNHPAYVALSAATPEVTPWANGVLLSTQMVTSFSPFTFAYDYPTILRTPVSLLRFDARPVGDKDAELSWQLADMANVGAMRLEHSTDGQSFKPLAQVAPGIATGYSYQHSNIAFGANFYRLVITDRTGQVTNSAIKQVNRTGQLITRIHGLKANPVRTDALLRVTSASNQQLHWRLVDLQGKLLLSGKTGVTLGENVVRLPMPMIPNGLFFLDCRTEDGASNTLKLVKE